MHLVHGSGSNVLHNLDKSWSHNLYFSQLYFYKKTNSSFISAVIPFSGTSVHAVLVIHRGICGQSDARTFSEMMDIEIAYKIKS